MEVPPSPLDNRRVLEYVVFDESVRRANLKFLRSASSEPLPIAGMAICEFLGDPPTIQLCYCDSSWKIDSVNFWRVGGPSMPFVSLRAVRTLAERHYTGTASKWIKVAELSEPFQARAARPAALAV